MLPRQDNQEWEVEEIIDHRIRKIKNPKSSRYENRKEYLLKWKGFNNPSWEPEENLINCQQLLKEYLRKVTEKEQNDYKNNSELKEKILDILTENGNSSSNKKITLLSHQKHPRSVYKEEKFAAVINSQNIINNINIEKETNCHRTINFDNLCTSSLEILKSQAKTNCNSEKDSDELNNIKILDVIGVRFPKNNSESIIYKLKMKINGKKETKMVKKENNMISNELLVKFYENTFWHYHKGEYVGN